MMNKKNIIFCILVIIIIHLLGFFEGYKVMRSRCLRISDPDTVYTVYYDTIKVTTPVPVDSTVIRYVTIAVPTAAQQPETDAHNGPQDGHHTTDSAIITLPITQKRYQDSTYTAYVSGFQPSLDSIFIYPKHEIVTITKPVPVNKQKRFGVGIQTGCGVGRDGLTPYIGVGISYNLLNF